MRTITIIIDEPTLKRVDRLVTHAGFHFRNRAEVIGKAVEQFVKHLERESEEPREAEIFRRHRSRLNRQAKALIKEQVRR